MCGIAGELAFDRPVQAHAPYLQAQAEALYRRGPDQGGTYCDSHAALIHRRLAVVDPVKGRQPMTCGHLTVVYNGELYNTEELRRELQAHGCTFDGHSDTEVVLQAYRIWGADCASRFNGIFAFAVYDAHSRKLDLFRDPMGVKPLFYAIRGSSLLFASELKTLLLHPLVRPEITREGLCDLVLLGPGRTPGSGVFRDVSELLPGQMARYDESGLHLSYYWQLQDAPCTDTFEEAAEKTRFLVTDAIKRQLVSDVPLCTLLSGGLDSSIISAVAAGEKDDLCTYCVDYRDNDRYFKAGKFQPNSDGPYIQRMLEHIGTHHTRVELDTPELVDALFLAADARDLPGMADVDASMLLLCRQIKRTHTVALSGECADEIFGGYPWYRDPEIRQTAGFPWAQTTDYRASFLLPDWIDEAPEDYVNRKYEQTIQSAHILPDAPALERRMKEMMVLNLKWFMQTLLDRKDRMSMYWGLEVRVPFCDKRIVEYLYTVPWEFKDYRGREKGLLRHAMGHVLPQEIVQRKKSPYPKTWNPDYFRAVADRLEAVLAQPDCPLKELFQTDRLLALTREDRAIPWYGQLMTTPQTIAYFLQMEWWLRKFKITIVT
jgi:asparagine synthase (glutamine-hydrolysing)